MIDELAMFPARLRSAVNAAGPKLRIRARDGRFAIVEHCCHLADLEAEGYGARIEKLLHDERPEWDEFDGEKIAMERNYLEQDAEEALQRFVDARASNVARLRAVRDDQWELRGTHRGMGEVSLRELVEAMVEHDRAHANDIQVLLKELEG